MPEHSGKVWVTYHLYGRMDSAIEFAMMYYLNFKERLNHADRWRMEEERSVDTADGRKKLL